MNKKVSLFTTLSLVFVILLSACRPAAQAPATTAPTQGSAAQPTAAVQPTSPPASTNRTKVRWFVGLGAGSDEPTFAAQEAVVAAFNASQNEIELVLEIVDNDVAYDTLATQIAAGNAPDIVGPVGIRGRDAFKGAWADLQPFMDSSNYDISDFDPGMVDFYHVQEEGQLGLPFGIFPSFLLYNADLFDEAGLPYPPSEYGQPYVDENGNSLAWSIETMSEVARKLTVDANGNDAASADFDPNAIVQFGYGEQWTDARGWATLFGAGSLVGPDNTAKIPAQWRQAWQWAYDAMWTDYFVPNGPYGNSDVLGGGNWFQSGNMGMVHAHLWYVACCMGELTDSWEVAAVPSYNGTVTAKMHADTFGILKASKNQEAAWKVLTYLLDDGANDLLAIYGGMPARLSLQDGYFDKAFPGKNVNWDMVVAGMAHADNPNHESYMPSFQEANDRYNEFWNKITNNPGLNLKAEIDQLEADLTSIFKAAGN
jgi:multiple sugar transport system substrate-binding protein